MGKPSVVELLAQLALAAKGFDEERALAVVGSLADGVRGGDLVPTETEQARMFAELRSCRWFAAMERIGNALVAAKIATCLARRQLGQALIEQGSFDEALDVLERVAVESACAPAEVAEARGLVGRVYKQLYVDRSAALGPARRWTIESSIRSYLAAYESDHTKYTWQGVNAAAMLVRAERDGLAVTAARPARDVAREIVATLEDPALHWDIATRAEAHLALGEWAEASSWIVRYAVHPEIDAFAAASTLRQLKQVWQLREGGPGGEMLTLLQAAVLARSTPRRSTPLALSAGELQVAENSARDRGELLEKVFGAKGPRSHEWYLRGLTRARSVARVETATGTGIGTAFLVRADSLFTHLPDPGELVLVTNSHVVGLRDPEALRPGAAVVRFEALDTRRTFRIRDVLFESPPGELDVTIVRLDAAVAGAEPVPLAASVEPTFDPARELFVIGHPHGGALALSIDDNLQVGWRLPKLHYRTPTLPGSSGSPVFDESWNLVALHHAGSDVMPRLDDPTRTYQANEGIWIHSIRSTIAATPAAQLPIVGSSPPAVRAQTRRGVFISYAHADRRWLERLRPHLKPALAGSPVDAWDDTRIAAGSDWLGSIRAELDRASIAILLVSHHFLASDFILREELPPLLSAAARNGLVIVPIAIGSAMVERVPELAALQFANNPQTPLDELDEPARNRELVRIARLVGALVDTTRVTNQLRAMDSAAYQATGLGGHAPVEMRIDDFSTHARQGPLGVELQRGTQTQQLLSHAEVEALDADARRLIRAFEAGITLHYERYTEAFGRRAALDPVVRARTEDEISDARRALCTDFNGLLDFFAALGKSLDDHYRAIRFVCRRA